MVDTASVNSFSTAGLMPVRALKPYFRKKVLQYLFRVKKNRSLESNRPLSGGIATDSVMRTIPVPGHSRAVSLVPRPFPDHKSGRAPLVRIGILMISQAGCIDCRKMMRALYMLPPIKYCSTIFHVFGQEIPLNRDSPERRGWLGPHREKGPFCFYGRTF